jgi:hypothetical protein
MKAWNITQKRTTLLRKLSVWSSSFYIAFGVLLLVPVSCNYETATVTGQHEQYSIPPPVNFDLDKLNKR